MRPTIIFDFDGTVALGDGPITAFAREIAQRTGDSTFASRATVALAAFESGDAPYRDGYDAVTRVATADGVDADILEASYGSSRALLGSPEAEVVPPEGLAEFLATVGASARLVLATNAPGDGVVAVLTAWGIADAFDAMHFTVGKPGGLVPVMRDALAEGPVLAIGDIAEFDLAPGTTLGADTALVGATFARSDAPVTMRGRTLADLYAEITDWVTTASSSPSTPLRPTERHI